MVIKYSREENIKVLMYFLKMVSNIDTALNLFSEKNDAWEYQTLLKRDLYI